MLRRLPARLPERHAQTVEGNVWKITHDTPLPNGINSLSHIGIHFTDAFFFIYIAIELSRTLTCLHLHDYSEEESCTMGWVWNNRLKVVSPHLE